MLVAQILERSCDEKQREAPAPARQRSSTFWRAGLEDIDDEPPKCIPTSIAQQTLLGASHTIQNSQSLANDEAWICGDVRGSGELEKRELGTTPIAKPASPRGI